MNQLKEEHIKPNQTKPNSDRERIKAHGKDIPLALQFLIKEGACQISQQSKRDKKEEFENGNKEKVRGL